MPEEPVSIIAGPPEVAATSESEEMYLITVARAGEDGRSGPVPVADIARRLSVSVTSAHQMVRKLADRELVTYEPYRGVQLSGTGCHVADRVLRTRRLWATFLADHLGFSPGEADEQACELEHVTSADTAEQLASFLGNPEAGPLGRPIPAATSNLIPHEHLRLTDMSVGRSGKVVAVSAAGGEGRFLTEEGVAPGALLTITAIGSSGLVVDASGSTVHLSNDLARCIEIHPKDES
ncbi:MAG: metal-dependent transcriptional regulator [Actinomycetota bacterium]|nr:metal-dependent transcriptional regulator [Actinomycetota bacterium]